jgi:hypothetical protein
MERAFAALYRVRLMPQAPPQTPPASLSPLGVGVGGTTGGEEGRAHPAAAAGSGNDPAKGRTQRQTSPSPSTSEGTHATHAPPPQLHASEHTKPQNAKSGDRKQVPERSEQPNRTGFLSYFSAKLGVGGTTAGNPPQGNTAEDEQQRATATKLRALGGAKGREHGKGRSRDDTASASSSSSSSSSSATGGGAQPGSSLHGSSSNRFSSALSRLEGNAVHEKGQRGDKGDGGAGGAARGASAAAQGTAHALLLSQQQQQQVTFFLFVCLCVCCLFGSRGEGRTRSLTRFLKGTPCCRARSRSAVAVARRTALREVPPSLHAAQDAQRALGDLFLRQRPERPVFRRFQPGRKGQNSPHCGGRV